MESSNRLRPYAKPPFQAKVFAVFAVPYPCNRWGGYTMGKCCNIAKLTLPRAVAGTDGELIRDTHLIEICRIGSQTLRSSSPRLIVDCRHDCFRARDSY